MVGLPWSQHVAFLDDRRLKRDIRREIAAAGRRARRPSRGADVRARQRDSAGRRALARARRASSGSCASLYQDAKAAAPESLFTYVNFPPTEFLDLSFFDVCAFNVYLHREAELRAYLARLQHIAGHKPLLLAEAGADSIREGEDGPGRDHGDARPRGVRGRRVRRDRVRVDRRMVARRPSGRGLGVRPRRSRAPPEAGGGGGRRGVRRRAVLAASGSARWPRVSVVVCAYNAADTLDDCLRVARARSRIPTTKSSSSTTARRIARARSRTAIRGCASSTRRTAA